MAFVRIGRRGELRLQPGFYIYLGSALGPGGVRARLALHFRPCTRPHWHLDYLRAHAVCDFPLCGDRISFRNTLGAFLLANPENIT